ncbi:mammalian cell entry-like protein [Rodentibacter pneumotropicus]|uniref:Mammalian cell entry-like protein n=1 Tax=Rodentibacter pneumotropicus TaxID=758 RepID=A0A3S4XTE3_9PAST|nr:mammalian cell entry-like protein [Rodentibacter pneumotropicus]
MAASNFDVNLGIDGVRFESAHPEKWLQGGVRIIAKKGLGDALKSYPLYKDTQNAESGITGNLVEPDITLKLQLYRASVRALLCYIVNMK